MRWETLNDRASDIGAIVLASVLITARPSSTSGSSWTSTTRAVPAPARLQAGIAIVNPSIPWLGLLTMG